MVNWHLATFVSSGIVFMGLATGLAVAIEAVLALSVFYLDLDLDFLFSMRIFFIWDRTDEFSYFLPSSIEFPAISRPSALDLLKLDKTCFFLSYNSDEVDLNIFSSMPGLKGVKTLLTV